ncbi:MAG: hypothetical protein GX657_10405 [Chloroflexi bacterium]|nr:hypothetical protein [Chloroflexota bacterium]
MWAPLAKADVPEAPLLLARDVGQNALPQVTVGPDGQARVVWLQRSADGDLLALHGAASPDWTATLLAAIPPYHGNLGAPAFDLTPAPLAYLAWPQPVSGSMALQVRDLATDTEAVHLLAARPPSWTYAVDGSGRPHAVWAEGNAIYYWAAGQVPALAIEVASAARVSDLSLAVTPAGRAHVAWLSWTDEGRPGGVYIGDLADGETILVAQKGQSPCLLAAGEERLFLFWSAADGLWAAADDHWREGFLVAPRLSGGARPALAADESGRAYVAWQADGRLWLADSSSWVSSRRALADLPGPAEGLSMAAESDGRLHLAWTTEGVRGWEVYYLRAAPPVAGLAIVAPSGGGLRATLDIDARAVSVSEGVAPLVRVSFWAEEWPAEGAANGLRAAGGLWHALGADTEGGDGWSTPVGARLPTAGTYRVVALGTDVEGRTVRAYGDWFQCQADDAPLVLLDRVADRVLRGRDVLGVLVGSPSGEPVWSEYALVSEEGQDRVFLGALEHPWSTLWPQTGWTRLPVDSRTLADGAWRLHATAWDAAGRRASATSAVPLTVDNAMRPRVRLTSPLPGQALEGTVSLVAEADDPDGRVERVEFYIERAFSPWAGSADEAPQAPAGLWWVGSDADGSDGWEAHGPLDPALDGNAWIAWAIAYDDQGLATAAHTAGTFALLAAERPYIVLAVPSPGSVLRGVHPVTLHVPAGYPYLAAARLYALGPSGLVQPVGEFRPEEGRWLCPWDTTALPDGEYGLLVTGEDAQGRAVLARGGPVRLANRAVSLRFVGLAEGEALSGLTVVRLEAQRDGPQPTAVRLYRQMADGELDLLGEGLPREGGWAIPWDTRRTVDGAYDLLALGWGEAGFLARAQRRVLVQNATPTVASVVVVPVEEGQEGDALRGQARVSWRASHPAGAPLSAWLDYSPDGGRLWLAVDAGLPAEATYSWDTRLFPDTRDGLLRVRVSDGSREASATSAPLAVNNLNESPQVTLLAPAPGQVLGGAARVAWQAWDPDGDALRARVDVRLGDGEWLPLCEPEPDTGSCLWDTSLFEEGSDYTLRVTVEDPAGAVGSDLAKRLVLMRNSPPVVHLFAPRGDVPLRGEAIVLWTTFDADEDPLRVDLYYSDNAGQTWLPLAEDLADAGYYVWQFSYLPSGIAYRLRIVVRDAFSSASDQSDLLVIEPPLSPGVAVRSPVAGQEVYGWFPLTWSLEPAGGAERRIDIAARREDGDWQPLASDLYDSGLYLWDTTALADGAYELAVQARLNGDAVARSTVRQVLVRNGPSPAPDVRLLSPRGGEVWRGWHAVRWEVTGGAGDRQAMLYISANGGWDWAPLAQVDARAGVYLWDTRTVPDGERYLLRLEVRHGESVGADKSPGAFRVANGGGSPPEVHFLSPDAAGVLDEGLTVRWEAQDSDGDALRVALDLSKDGGQEWRLLYNGLAASGEVSLASPAVGPDHLLRLRADDGLFEVAAVSAPLDWAAAYPGAPTLALEVPVAGEIWAGVQEARWSTQHPEALAIAVDLAISADGGHTWTSLAEGSPNTGVYDIDTTAWPNGVYRLRVTAHLGTTAVSQVSAPLMIDNPGGNAPVVSLVAPGGGETWSGAREVRWHTYDADGDPLSAELLYSVDGGATFRLLAEMPPDVESYIWDTSTVPNCDRVFLQVRVRDGLATAQDTLVQPLAIRNPDTPVIVLRTPVGPVWTGLQRLAWQTSGAEPPAARVVLEWSVEEGRSWRTLAADLPLTGSLLWDSAAIPEGASLTVRARLVGEEDLAIAMQERPVLVRGNRVSGAGLP